jgi:hypothetical protein
MLARCRAAVLVTCVLLPAPVAAVETSWRIHTAMPAQWAPTFGLGFVMRVPIGAPPEPTPSASGVATLKVRNWFVHTLAAGSLDTGEIDEPVLFLEAGIVRRTHRRMVDRAGIMVMGTLGRRGIGPALRLEVLNGLVALQPGWMWIEGGHNGPSLTVDISLSLIGDIFRNAQSESGRSSVGAIAARSRGRH